MTIRIEQQCHGYKSGHQLLAGSIRLSRDDQDTVDRLSDISGPLRPNETFTPYLTGYLLPSNGFYVIAKTWQDLDAPRAGCVLTRSLLIPSENWASLEWIDSLFVSIKPVDRAAIQADGFDFAPVASFPPPASAIRGVELVEALFLEERKPIVVFDEPEAEIIARRLLNSFWPGLRKAFSICSYALSPRQIGGRSFDLVFSPSESRSRFAKWEGRRVEGGSQKPKQSRHRWSAATARKIFEEPEPNLTRLDTLGVLRQGQSGDESDFRLTLLWNDLVEQSATSPTAILGMLDVLHTRNLPSGNTNYDVQPLASRAIELARSSYAPLEMLKFLAVLLGKMSEEKISLGILKSLQRSFGDAAEAGPRDALSFLVSNASVKLANSSVAWAGIGDGLAMAGESALASASIEELPEEGMLRLLADSRRFAARTLYLTTRHADLSWKSALLRALTFPDDALLAKARRNLLPHLDRAEQADVLAGCLRGADSRAIASAVRQLWKSTGFNIAEFDAPLIKSIRGPSGVDSFRNEILGLPDTDNTNRLLTSTLHSSPQDVRWLLEQNRLTKLRRSTFLQALLNDSEEDELRVIAQDPKVVEDIVSLFSSEERAPVPEKLAYLMIFGEIRVETLLQTSLKILPYLSGRTRSELVNVAVARGFRQGASEHDSYIRTLVDDESLTMPIEHVFAHAVSSGYGRDRLSRNIIILNGAHGRLRQNVLMQIDSLSDRITRIASANLTKQAIEAWADLVSNSGSANRAVQLRASSLVLSYVLALTDRPVSPLIVATFPVVYRELQEGHDAPSLFSFFFFTDWDRCRTARKDLVRAFLRSQWPPVDLVLAALPTGDIERVVRTLIAERGSGHFVHELKDQTQRLPNELRAQVLSALQNASDEGREQDSDAFLG